MKNFILHLRLHYNFLILSGPFFLGAVFAGGVANIYTFVWLYLITYVCLLGGANAFNSFFDKDSGPIGGLEHPPAMLKWMYYGSWAVQLLGLSIISYTASFSFGIAYVLAMSMFWLYSSPVVRLKARPLLSFLPIGIGTVVLVAYMGFVAAGGGAVLCSHIIGAIGAMLLILSMYPFSQLYQQAEDLTRGDRTFAVRYGEKGVRRVFKVAFPVGLVCLIYSFLIAQLYWEVVLVGGVVAYGYIYWQLYHIRLADAGYHFVMQTKYVSGLLFTITMLMYAFALSV